jgi:arylsulfatase A-like enzyme
MTEFELYNIAADPEEAKDLAAQMPEKTEKLKRELFKVWNSIEDEGPREWWRECQTKPIRNGNLAY